MDWIIVSALIGSGLLLPTAYAGLIGAPWAPTLIAVVKKAFDSMGISEKDVVADLGCGDGKIMVEAVRRGARAVGYELSPIMWFVSWVRLVSNKRAKVRYGNFLTETLPKDTTVIFTFLMPKHMEKIRQYIAKQNVAGSVIVLSYAFPITDVPARTVFRANKCAPLYMYTVEDIR